MLRLAKLTDYAIVVLAHLARHAHQCVHPASELAEATQLPLPTAQKVLKKLTRGGLLLSSRGAHGGYSLARDPATLTLVEVIETVEGPVGLTACSVVEGETCDNEAHCHLSGHWPVINDAVRSALEAVTILDLARTAPSSSVLQLRAGMRAAGK